MNFKLALAAAVAVVGLAGTAQAADLGKKAPAAANYVKVCDAYGEGFFYIPGSETCLKIGGYVYAQYGVYKQSAAWGLAYGTRTGENAISTGARVNLHFDARTNTELGLLRSYIELQQTIGSQPWANGFTGTSLVSMEKGFIQFAGLTAGRATSMFDFYTGDHLSSIYETAHSDTIINLLGYTFSFGNGISATVAIEDPSTGNGNGRRYDPAGVYGPVKHPDYVANVNIAQSWGSAQLMAAVHQNTSVAVSNKFGYAIGGGVKVNLPMLGASDTLSLQAAYSKGALSYVSPDWYNFGNYAAEDFFVAGGTIRQTAAWSIAGGITHGWTKTVSSALTASYANYDQPTAAGIDFRQFDIGGNLTWTPVTGLSIIGEVEYKNVDFTGVAAARAGLVDRNGVVGFLRIRRDF
ncbi:MAG: porin [Siculibacillus sp.]|nr:porin [Siculibacillus sp.]